MKLKPAVIRTVTKRSVGCIEPAHQVDLVPDYGARISNRGTHITIREQTFKNAGIASLRRSGASSQRNVRRGFGKKCSAGTAETLRLLPPSSRRTGALLDVAKRETSRPTGS